MLYHWLNVQRCFTVTGGSVSLKGVLDRIIAISKASLSTKVRNYSSMTSFLKPPDGVFVQVLPVLIPPVEDKLSTVVCSSVEESKRKILLCKWLSGDYIGRFTGLIRALSPTELENIHEGQVKEKKDILRQIAFDILPSSLQSHVTELDLVALLRFEDPPVYDEYVYIANLAHTSTTIAALDNGSGEESVINCEKSVTFQEHPCFWFPCSLAGIPFAEMPADDEIWYPKVLWEGGDKPHKVKGSFTFGGWSEKTIKSYELVNVDKVL